MSIKMDKFLTPGEVAQDIIAQTNSIGTAHQGMLTELKNEVVNLENMPARDDLLKEFTDKVDELNQSSDFHRIGWNPSKIILPFDVNKINEAMGAVKKNWRERW